MMKIPSLSMLEEDASLLMLKLSTHSWERTGNRATHLANMPNYSMLMLTTQRLSGLYASWGEHLNWTRTNNPSKSYDRISLQEVRCGWPLYTPIWPHAHTSRTSPWAGPLSSTPFSLADLWMLVDSLQMKSTSVPMLPCLKLLLGTHLWSLIYVSWLGLTPPFHLSRGPMHQLKMVTTHNIAC